jgi:hypothetical protein
MVDVIIFALSLLCVVAIVTYATWLLLRQLHGGEPRFRSFLRWLKHVFEAVWGL